MIEFVIGAGVAGVAFLFRQDRVQRDFLEKHEELIDKENERIADAWRASNPDKKKLVIDRKFKPPVFLPPTIHMRQTFKRDTRPWYERWFG